MALTDRQTRLAIAITFLALLVIAQLTLPTPATPAAVITEQHVLGIVITSAGLILWVISALISQGKLNPGPVWGRTAAAFFWSGIGMFGLGLGQLWRWLVPDGSPWTPKYVGLAIFVIAQIIALASVKGAAKI